MLDVFISYPRASRKIVEPLKLKLESLGFDCFFDVQSIDGGADFPSVVDRAVRNAKVVLGCWSKRAFASSWCMRECKMGLDRKVLVPVSIEAFAAFDVPVQFSGINYLDLTDWDTSDNNHVGWTMTLKALIRFIRPLSESPPAAIDLQPSHRDSSRDSALKELRRTWRDFPDKSLYAVERFLQRIRQVAPDSGLEFEVALFCESLRTTDEIEPRTGAVHQVGDDLASLARAPRAHAGYAKRRAGVLRNLVSPLLPDGKTVDRWWSEVTVLGKRYRIWAGRSGIEMGPSPSGKAPLDPAPASTTLAVDAEGRAAAWLRDGVLKLTWLNRYAETWDPSIWTAPRQKDLAGGRLLALSMYGSAGVLAIVSNKNGTFMLRITRHASGAITTERLAKEPARGAIIRRGGAIWIDAATGAISENDLHLGLEKVECIDEAKTTHGLVCAAVGMSGGSRVLVIKSADKEERISIESGPTEGFAIVRNSDASDAVILYADGERFAFSFPKGLPA